MRVMVTKWTDSLTSQHGGVQRSRWRRRLSPAELPAVVSHVVAGPAFRCCVSTGACLHRTALQALLASAEFRLPGCCHCPDKGSVVLSVEFLVLDKDHASAA